MFTKKNIVQAALGLALVSVGVTASAATTVPGGTVHFTGSIVNAACAVSADSISTPVNMGQYRTAEFASVGALSGAVPFTINLEGCDTTVSTTAAVSFSGNLDSIDNTILAVTNISGGATGAASGVGIQIADNTGNILKPDGSVFSAPTTLNTGSNVLHFSARYKSTTLDVTPGSADADATFVMQYN
ncbi:type 1 fimbrial major subunit FimA [Providencia sp. Je.9.19]|uniref:type 1 fimbrial major subunit FimA n=1 Tax=Providencia sp. Je.9.19 TaxID=3142844 RepID=UPI003DA8A13B